MLENKTPLERLPASTDRMKLRTLTRRILSEPMNLSLFRGI